MSVVRTTTLAAAALALAVAARPASAQALFEGQITMTLKSQRGSVPMELYMKDGMTRTDVSGQGGGTMSMINDPAKKEMLVIMTERQMYMRRSTDMASMPMNPNMPAPAAKPNIAKTGKTETIAGIKCEVYTISHESGESEEACLASGMGTFSPAGGGGMGGMMGGGRGMGGGGGQGSAPGAGGGRGGPQAQPMGWARDLDKGMFPLRVTKNGENIMEVTKVEKKKLDPTLFQVPEGFQEMNMGGGRGGRPPAE